MATLLSLIKDMQLEARKARRTVAASLLTTLIGEASMPGKNDGNRESTDAEVIATIKKFVKNTNELIKALTTEGGVAPTNEEALAIAKKELEILEALLPKQMNEAELRKEITNIIEDAERAKGALPVMGNVMRALKQSFDGQYDGAMASRLIKELLA